MLEYQTTGKINADNKQPHPLVFVRSNPRTLMAPNLLLGERCAKSRVGSKRRKQPFKVPMRRMNGQVRTFHVSFFDIVGSNK